MQCRKKLKEKKSENINLLACKFRLTDKAWTNMTPFPQTAPFFGTELNPGSFNEHCLNLVTMYLGHILHGW